MLIKFSLSNYKTFRERVEWSMVATEDTTLEEDNVIPVPELGLRLLKSAVVYGANASGKSRLIEAIGLMKGLVRGLVKTGPDAAFPVEPFRLNSTSVDEPSEFEIIFITDGATRYRYRYGFEAYSTHVSAEWLYRKEPFQEEEINIFYRDEQEVELSEQSGTQLRRLRDDDIVRKNELLLFKAADYNSPDATRVYEWFRALNVITALDTSKYRNVLIALLNDSIWAPVLLDLIQAADLSISAAVPDMVDLDNLPGDITEEQEQRLRTEIARRGGQVQIWRDIATQHTVYDDNHQVLSNIWFRLQQEESRGTQQFFTLMALVLDTVRKGGILLVDELETALHPQLVSKIVSIFYSNTHNLYSAQLLFNTHDTNLLDAEPHFRSDQIWFTEKNRYGEARLYSLAEFQDLHPDDNIEQRYLQGLYGGVPFLGSFAAPLSSTITPQSNGAE